MVRKLKAPRKEVTAFLVACPRELLLLRSSEVEQRLVAWKTFCLSKDYHAWCAVLGCLPQVLACSQESWVEREAQLCGEGLFMMRKFLEYSPNVMTDDWNVLEEKVGSLGVASIVLS